MHSKAPTRTAAIDARQTTAVRALFSLAAYIAAVRRVEYTHIVLQEHSPDLVLSSHRIIA